jgi:hypothetical protein
MLSMMKIHSNSIRARNINESLNESSLYDPQNIAFDLLGNLWVADSYNNRVLMYKADRIHPNRFHNGQPANVVIGQPDFSSNDCPRFGYPTHDAPQDPLNEYVVPSPF